MANNLLLLLKTRHFTAEEPFGQGSLKYYDYTTYQITNLQLAIKENSYLMHWLYMEKRSIPV